MAEAENTSLPVRVTTKPWRRPYGASPRRPNLLSVFDRVTAEVGGKGEPYNSPLGALRAVPSASL
jgi:hypothetical protein